MIAAVGLDLVDLGAFREQLEDTASTFVERTFTEAERRESRQRPSGDASRHLAGRFAAKEAFIKAWSSINYSRPPTSASVDMRQIEVVSDAFGRPALRLTGDVQEALSRSAPLRSHVSLTHDGGYAGAVVVLEWETPG